MKKLSFILSIFSILYTSYVILSHPAPASAKVMLQETGTITIPQGEVIDDDLFIAGESVVINGEIKGDVFVGTGNLTLSGATIGGSLIAGSGNVTIDQTSYIGGSLVVGTGNLSNSASVGRNIMAAAGNIYINNKVGKEARLGAGNIELGPDTEVAGDLTYALGDDDSVLTLDPDAIVSGDTTRYTPPAAKQDIDSAKQDLNRFGSFAHKSWLVISFIGSLLLGYLLIKLFPKTALGLSAYTTSSLLPSLGTGFLIVVAAIPVFLVLALTIIGLPILGVLIPLFCIELHLAKLITSYALGQFVAKQFSWNKLGVYAIYSLGLAIFYILRALPGIGALTSILFTWVGLGTIWLYTRSHLKNL